MKQFVKLIDGDPLHIADLIQARHDPPSSDWLEIEFNRDVDNFPERFYYEDHKVLPKPLVVFSAQRLEIQADGVDEVLVDVDIADDRPVTISVGGQERTIDKDTAIVVTSREAGPITIRVVSRTHFGAPLTVWAV